MTNTRYSLVQLIFMPAGKIVTLNSFQGLLSAALYYLPGDAEIILNQVQDSMTNTCYSLVQLVLMPAGN